jgi:hypothetical protein
MIAKTLNTPRELTRDILRAMRKQEENAYRIPTQHLKELVLKECAKEEDCGESDLLFSYFRWRGEMSAWCYSIAKQCDFQNGTVEIAISMADRYVAASTDVITDSSNFQIVCVACLYTSTKIHEERCLTSGQMEQLSFGRYPSKEIEEMEMQVLSAIQWRVNPPTAISFARNLLELVPLNNFPDRRLVLEVVEAQIELAMTNAEFISITASLIGFAALMNGLQCVLGHSRSCYYFHIFAPHLGFDKAACKSKSRKLQTKLSSLVAGTLNCGYDETAAEASNDKGIEEPCKPSASYPASPASVIIKRKYKNKSIETC